MAAAPASAGGGRNPFREPDESEFFELDAKLVTVASRYAQSLRKAPNVVTVIDADLIRRRGYRTLSDALRDLPGVYIWTSPEGRHLVSFRGVMSADNNKVLLLVDGVPLYDGVYTHAWVDDYLPIHNVQQVEVIKGPGSAVYGTNAFAGVINVVTFRGEALQGGRGHVLVGSHGRVDASITAGGRQEIGAVPIEMSGYARVLTQDGDGIDITPEGRRDLRSEDPKRGVAMGATLGVGGLTVRLHHIDYRHSYLTQEQDDLFDMLGGDIDDFGLNYHATVADLRWSIQPIPQLTITPRVFGQRHDNPGIYAFWDVTRDEDDRVESFDVQVVETEKDTRQWGLGLDGEVRPHPDHVTVLGLGLDNLSIVQLEDIAFRSFVEDGVATSFRAPRGARLRNAHAYLSHTWTVAPPVEVTLGGRLDKRIPANPDDDGSALAFRLLASPRVGLMLAPTPEVHAKILYGRAFRHANVRETLVTTEAVDGEYPFANGSLDLRPEQVDTVDVELQGEPSEVVTLRAAGSWSTLRYEIDKVTPPNEYQNLDGALNIATAEAEVTADAGLARFRAAYAFTWALYDDKGLYAGRSQYEFPPHMLKGNLEIVPAERWSATLTGEIYSPRPRKDWAPTSGLEDGPAFGLLHISARATDLGPGGRLQVTAAVRNLTDTAYQTGVYRDEIDRMRGEDPRYVQQIEAPGRSVQVGVEVEF